MFKFLGRLAASRPWAICTAWLVAGALLAVVAPSWDSKTQDDDIRFLPDVTTFSTRFPRFHVAAIGARRP